MCEAHYDRWRKYGDPTVGGPLKKRARVDPLVHVLKTYTPTTGPLPTPCWVRARCLTTDGYSQMRVDGKLEVAHRVVYERLRGSIPDGLQLDHLCRVRNCINPDHLEPVTLRENVLRGDGAGARAVRTNRCKWGHSLDDAYVYTWGRACRTCVRLRNHGHHPPY